ncbi:MAG: hypothetical protein RAO94_11465 [Candidatus Stygibacter australis]|nr:hypothetical protein [Candidatus Stygibacter australis]
MIDKEENNYQLVESYAFEEGFYGLEMTKPDEYNSGTLSLGKSHSEDGMHDEIFSFNGINDVKKYQVDNEYIFSISPHGEYFMTMKDHKEYILRTKNGDMCYSIIKNDLARNELSSTGCQLFEKRENDHLLFVNNQGSIICDIPSLRDTIEGSILVKPLYFKDQLQAVIIGKGMTADEQIDKFPKESRIYFFNNDYSVSHYISIDGGLPICHSNEVENEEYLIYESYTGKKSFDYGNKRIHILRNDQEIMQFEGGMTDYSYSPDGKMVIMNLTTSRGQVGYIIDLEKAEIMRKLDVRCASNSSIASKEYPFLAYWFYDKVKVVNYLTGELVLEEEVKSDKYVKGMNYSKIQISGNGKQLTVFKKNLYKKYRILSGE